MTVTDAEKWDLDVSSQQADQDMSDSPKAVDLQDSGVPQRVRLDDNSIVQCVPQQLPPFDRNPDVSNHVVPVDYIVPRMSSEDHAGVLTDHSQDVPSYRSSFARASTTISGTNQDPMLLGYP